MDRQIEKRNIFTKAMDTLNKGLSVLEAQISKLFGRKLEKPAGEGIHLSGMDRVVEKTPWQQYRKFIIYGGGAVTLLLMILIFMPEGGRALKVQNDRIVISEVIEGEFDDYIPVRAQVAPLKTVYLDAIDGGTTTTIPATAPVTEEGESDGDGESPGDAAVPKSDPSKRKFKQARKWWSERSEKLNRPSPRRTERGWKGNWPHFVRPSRCWKRTWLKRWTMRLLVESNHFATSSTLHQRSIWRPSDQMS
ncbi:MAG: hypothetical protein IH901_05080 [Proteobacteria bacterium]|nr:hypothetical protein [Pseudomonadota bacterium]